MFAALTLRVLWPKRTLVVGAFSVADGKSDDFSLTEKAAANLFADELHMVVGRANRFFLERKPSALNNTTLLNLGRAFNPASVDVEVSGFSPERVLAIWNRIRQKQERITGDVISSPEGLFLRVRNEEGSAWPIGPFPLTAEDYRLACHQLALALLADYRPDIAGLYYESHGEHEKALSVYRSWLRRDPTNATAHFYLGNSFYGMDKIDDAIAAYRVALQLEPESPAALNNLGNALALQSNTIKEAIDTYKQALRLNPQDEQVLSNLGIAYTRDQNYQSAINCQWAALALNPNEPRILLRLGKVLGKNCQLNQAIEHYKKALSVALAPDILVEVGEELNRAGQYEEAQVAYLKALRLDPKYATAHFGLARALACAGIATQSRLHFEKAIEGAASDADKVSYADGLRQLEAMEKDLEKRLEGSPIARGEEGGVEVTEPDWCMCDLPVGCKAGALKQRRR